MAKKNTNVAWLEIHSGVLNCICGTQTLLMQACFDMRGTLHAPLAGCPTQTCPGCGRKWWAPGAADCEPLDDESSDERTNDDDA